MNKIKREESFLVYISHTWLRTGEKCPSWTGFLHPDIENGEKYTLLVEGVQKLWDSVGKGLYMISVCYINFDVKIIPLTQLRIQ